MIGSTAYVKPFGKELFGKQMTAQYVYPREELIREEIFPYFVFDGGAFNLLHDRFGTADGKAMLQNVLSGKLFEEFEYGGAYHWERSFAYTGESDFRRRYEWQIWPQRLYMILPLAHAFLRTKEASYAQKWLETVRGWADAHPYQPFDGSVSYLQTDMVWRDMQVAWRTLSLLHSLFMLEDAPFAKEDWAFLYDFVRLHAEHLYKEAVDRLSRQHVQNHVLQIGVALMLCGVMFPEFDLSEKMLDAGKQVVQMNMAGIFPEGASDEDSPSYGHFIARLYLEAFLMLKNNGLEMIPGLEESVRKQYEWLYLTTTPCGNAPRISDSYGMDANADLARVKRLIDLRLPKERGNVFGKNAQFAVLRQGDITLYVDALPYAGGHHHSGRPQTLLYFQNAPVLVDGGCCNYDRWPFYLALRGMGYHNVVYSPLSESAEYSSGTQIDSGIISCENDTITCFAEVKNDAVAYRWERTLTIRENTLIIEDQATSDADIPWRARLLFRNTDTKMDSPTCMRQMTETSLLTVTSTQPFEQVLLPVMNDENRMDYAVVAEINTHGRTYTNRVEIRMETRTY